MKKKTLLSWSSGKDSAWALHVLRLDPSLEIVGLLTTINEKVDRVSMHSTRRELLDRQADAAGLPLETVDLPDPCSNDEYAAAMRRFVEKAVARGIECMAFGDLFLDDIREYREKQLYGTGTRPVFPLWGSSTRNLAEEMLSAGIEAYVSCVDLKKLPSDLAGRKWNQDLIDRFPQDVDPCGENGEFHTVVTAGPMFSRRIPVRTGEVIERDGFAWADIVPDG